MRKSILPISHILANWHRKTLERPMTQWWQQKAIPPVLLLTGPNGIGKRSTCYYLAQWIFCEKSGFQQKEESPETSDFFGSSLPSESAPSPIGPTLQPCGECNHCHKAIQGTWVDFTEIASDQGDDPSTALKVEDFRKLKSTLGFGAFDGNYRITLIRDADRMTVQAANSLLKLLEEPPPGWIFLMTASDPSLLLPTIVSRCQKLRLSPLPAECVFEMIEESVAKSQTENAPALTSKDKLKACSQMAQGSIRRALELIDEAHWEDRAQVLQFLEKPRETLSALVDWAAQDEKQFHLLLDTLEQSTNELVVWSLSGSQDPNAKVISRPLIQHAQMILKKLGDGSRAREFWIKQAERVYQARRQSQAPLNRKLLIQDLLLPWTL